MTTKIKCNVSNCIHHKDEYCNAEMISVACDHCLCANNSCQTKCNSFKCK